MGFVFIIVGLVTLFLVMSLRYVPSQPPHIAVVTVLGKRRRIVKAEGLRLFPFYPYITNAILIDISKKHQDLPNITVRTPDLGEMTISASITWMPLPENAIEYLDHGGEKGIRTLLQDSMHEALRKWAAATEGGPKDWVEALKTPQETAAVVLSMLAGLTPDLSPSERGKISQRIRTGEGVLIPQLGIVFNRLRIRGLDPSGTIVRATETIARERKEREAEAYEIRGLQGVIQELKQTLGVTNDQAIELVQTERGKVEKKIQEFKINASPAVLATVWGVIERFTRERT